MLCQAWKILQLWPLDFDFARELGSEKAIHSFSVNSDRLSRPFPTELTPSSVQQSQDVAAAGMAL